MGFCPFGSNARNMYWHKMGWIKVECQSVIKTMVERRPLIMITTPAALTRYKWCLFTKSWFVFKIWKNHFARFLFYLERLFQGYNQLFDWNKILYHDSTKLPICWCIACFINHKIISQPIMIILFTQIQQKCQEKIFCWVVIFMGTGLRHFVIVW